MLIDQNRSVVDERSFDAWGRNRNPVNWTYSSVPAMLITNRGYTTHEHLTDYGIVNMNGRLYDPIVGRMFNADPFIANPNSSQDYNRYSYVRNNPLRYTDPSGFMGVGMQKTYHYRIMDFAAINGKLATDCHDAILQMKMMGQKGVESQYLEALLWAEQSEGGEGSESPGVPPDMNYIFYSLISYFLGNDEDALKAFQYYWWGGGNMQLTNFQFNEISKKIISGDIKIENNLGCFEKIPDYSIYEINTNGTSFENWIGRAYIIQDNRTGEYVGFFDKYDFDWDLGRGTINNLKTIAVSIASWSSSSASSYYIYYWK